ncbi:Gnt-I system low-affinity gluconate transporter [Melghirimyces profundicolus]|uniref:Gnt-I system low-affinity gluconate transporter n=1 Tax=Melghirimyces profundicolus TaxID=1242148 RepID=A0A2T6C507_9BACL|nr:gluconate:H+ symporter [Melghirimyces profundicolus]PTX63363.1 Gnt-I system low-affinity gluconate transporter [Melghirimyces profundicolus]
MSSSWLFIGALVSILLVLFLVMKSKWQAFVALLFSSFVLGLLSGMPVNKIIESVEKGMGGTLGFVAVVIGLGAMFGRMLEVSGGAERLARTLIASFGEKRAQWALALTGFVVSIPVFLDVALVILIPIIYSLGKKTGKSLLYYGIPLLAGLAVTHSFIPPTPGPIAVADIIGADLGWVILFGLLAGIPATIIAGPLFGRYIADKIHAAEPEYMRADKHEIDTSRELPSFSLILTLILLPLVLILGNTLSGVMLPEGNSVRNILTFIGHPFAALLLVTLLSFFTLGRLRGYTKEDVQSIATKALEPAGIIILITGAGGVFKQVLIDSGVGEMLGSMMKDSGLPPVLLAFLIASIIRVAQGSATVAMITAAGLMTPINEALGLAGPQLGLVVIAIAAGATIASHVNDSGFWMVNRFFGLSERDTLRSWTVMETIIALVGFAVVFLLSFCF